MLKKIILILLYLMIAYSTYHTDHLYVSIFAERVANGDHNLYKRLDYTDFKDYKNISPIFPPIVQYTDGFVYKIFKKIGLYNFDLINAIKDEAARLDPTIVLLLKIRLLLPLFLTAFFIKKIGEFTRNKNYFISWLTSSLMIFSVFIQSNNDIYPTLFFTVALYFAITKNLYLAAILLGISASCKNYGLFFILPFTFLHCNFPKDYKKIFLLTITAFTTYLLLLLPFIDFLTHFVKSNGEGSAILKTRLFQIPVFPVTYLGLNLFGYIKLNKIKNKLFDWFILLQLNFLLLYLFTDLRPQWILWTLPVTLYLTSNSLKNNFTWMLFSTIFFLRTTILWAGGLDYNIFKNIINIPTINKEKLLTINSINSNLSFSVLLNISFYFLFVIFILYISKKRVFTKINQTSLAILNLTPLLCYFIFCFGIYILQK